MSTCTNCIGTGIDPTDPNGTDESCPHCGGTGETNVLPER